MTLWWKRGVIYQIYPRSFMDGSGDGIGDLRGAASRLDYLQWLGIDAIWFSPLFPSPMVDFGYDVSDYTDIHPDYGTLADFDVLLESAHKRGIKVLLDLVPNHTSDQHQWFIESSSSRDNPRRDWYIWKDPAPNGSPPNNWLSYFGGPAWTFDEATGQYYLHNFAPEQPELNWRNPAVKDAMFDVVRFWLSRGVDGFRIDVIDRIIKDDLFRDNPPDPNWQPGGNPVYSLRRIYSEGRPEIHDYMREFRGVFDEFPGTVLIGEVAYDLPLEKVVDYYGVERGGHGDELHLPFNFGLFARMWNAADIRAHVDEYDAAVPSYGWPNYVLGNHDNSRLATRIGPAGARLAAMLLLTLRGTPTLYYGDEIGMTDVPIPREKIQDPQGKNTPGFNRDEARTPMQWDNSPGGGFTHHPEPWLPLAADYATVNAAVQQTESDSMLLFYRRLLNYRRRTQALNNGRYYPVNAVPEDCFVYLRQYNDQTVLVALNFTGAPQLLKLPKLGTGRIAVATRMDREGQTASMASFTLLPDEGVIVALSASAPR